MKKLLSYILWPALAGLVFAFTLLQAPRLVRVLPGLAAYFPQTFVSAPAAPVLGSFNEAVRKSAPSVVSINKKETTDYLVGHLTPTGQFFAEDLIKDDSNSLGSGVIIRQDGYIITGYHVVFTETGASSEITVTLHDGRILEARIVSLDEKNDLALLKVDAEELPPLDLADTSRLQVGDVVLAIGNPRNVGQSVTFGIISALWQRDDSFVIQTDAAINPGNSGGALIDVDGDLVGINSTIVSESGGSEGIGFSIPADRALDLLAQYLASGPRGYLGVTTSALALPNGQRRFGQDIQGFEVEDIVTGGSADKAGIRIGDIITAVEGRKVSVRDERDTAEAWELMSSISDLPPGSQITVEVFRDSGFLQLSAILSVGVPQIFNVFKEVPIGPETDALSVPADIN